MYNKETLNFLMPPSKTRKRRKITEKSKEKAVDPNSWDNRMRLVEQSYITGNLHEEYRKEINSEANYIWDNTEHDKLETYNQECTFTKVIFDNFQSFIQAAYITEDFIKLGQNEFVDLLEKFILTSDANIMKEYKDKCVYLYDMLHNYLTLTAPEKAIEQNNVIICGMELLKYIRRYFDYEKYNQVSTLIEVIFNDFQSFIYDAYITEGFINLGQNEFVHLLEKFILKSNAYILKAYKEICAKLYDKVCNYLALIGPEKTIEENKVITCGMELLKHIRSYFDFEKYNQISALVRIIFNDFQNLIYSAYITEYYFIKLDRNEFVDLLEKFILTSDTYIVKEYRDMCTYLYDKVCNYLTLTAPEKYSEQNNVIICGMKLIKYIRYYFDFEQYKKDNLKRNWICEIIGFLDYIKSPENKCHGLFVYNGCIYSNKLLLKLCKSEFLNIFTEFTIISDDKLEEFKENCILLYDNVCKYLTLAANENTPYLGAYCFYYDKINRYKVRYYKYCNKYKNSNTHIKENNQKYYSSNMADLSELMRLNNEPCKCQ